MSSKLPQIGDRIIWRDKNGVAVITQGWENDYLFLCPRYGSDFLFEQWILIHKPTGYVLHRFEYDQLKLAKAMFHLASALDWRGSDWRLVPKETRVRWGEICKDIKSVPSREELAEESKRQQKAKRKAAKEQKDPQLNLLPAKDNIAELSSLRKLSK